MSMYIQVVHVGMTSAKFYKSSIRQFWSNSKQYMMDVATHKPLAKVNLRLYVGHIIIVTNVFPHSYLN